MSTDVAAGSLEGKRLGRYVLRHAVASGGMASVYLAQLATVGGFERWFAVKIIHPHLARDPRFATMFLDEARVSARIQHPNVCSVVDFGLEQGVPYLVMEYLHGETFSTVMRRGWADGGCPPWLAARIVGDAARGLHAAHTLAADDGHLLEIVHRDVSPQNIVVLYDGLSKIVDFGVARARGKLGVSGAKEVKGKLAYMAPEQLRKGSVGPHTDVWGLGVVLWEATVGRRLFRGENEGETVVNVLEAPIPEPSSIIDGYPPPLERVVLSALERRPEGRVRSAQIVADGLDEYLWWTGQPAGGAQVAEWMKGCFADRRKARDSLLRSGSVDLGTVSEVDLASASSVGSGVRSSDDEDDLLTDASDAEDEPLDGASGGQDEPPPTIEGGALPPLEGVPTLVAARPLARPVRHWPVVLGAAAVVAVVVGIAVGFLLPIGRHEPRISASPPPGEAAGEPRHADVAPAPIAILVAVSPPRGSPASAPTRLTEPTVPARAPTERTGTSATREEPGRLSLLAIPSCEVFLRGRSLGHTPLDRRTIAAGSQTLELRAANGRRKRVTVRIRPGETTRVVVRLGD